MGQVVSQGQTIGYVGCTGHCFGPHLHFEVRINGAPVDPLGYL
jgi:murein DD-endopeptidase MepM/ murein hydrolase activator NlpD